MPKLTHIIQSPLDQERQEQQQEKIHHYWMQETEHRFRKWKQGNQLANFTNLQDTGELEKELGKIRIRHDEGQDILRWGYRPKGNFTTSESYKIVCNNYTPSDPIWSIIWGLGSWPKISYFLWLVSHKKILTWDKLRRRNFHGPSMCPNCCQNEETLQHILDSCPLANQLWEKASFRCQRRCRTKNDITDSLRHWPQNPYKSDLLNCLWKLLPGIISWGIWKERNKRIFKNQSSRIEDIWSNLCGNLNETLMIHSWTPKDLPSLEVEKGILRSWQLLQPQTQHKISTSTSSSTIKDTWSAPPEHSYKLNFDGDSKGNPGKAGFVGILRNHEGTPLQIYFRSLGWDTNNSAEIKGLWQGLLLARNLNLQPLIVEGDSQILINMAKRLQNGSQAKKITNSWRLAARLEAIEQALRSNRAISFSHTKREGNKVTDLVANIGAIYDHNLITGTSTIITDNAQAREFEKLVQSDAASPDVGDTIEENGTPPGYHGRPQA